MRKWLIAFTLIFLALLAGNLYPGLRGGAGWRWPYALPDRWIPVLVLALLLIVYVLGVERLRRWSLPVWAMLAWSVLGGTALGIAVAGIPHGDAGFALFTRTVSPVQTGASALAVRIMARDGAQDTLERWPDVMREARSTNLIHFTTSPPGQPLIHEAAARIFARIPAISKPVSMKLRLYQCSDIEVMRYTRGELTSTVLGMLMPFWAVLAVLPIYASTRMLLRDSGAALRITQWWPLVPSALLFTPTWNTLYPFLCVTVFALLLAGVQRRGLAFAGRILAAGIMMSLTTFLNFAVLPVLLLLGFFTLGYWFFVLRRAGGVAWPVRVGVWFGAGLSSVWFVFWLVAGHTPFDLLAVTFGEHAELVQRDYLPWLILHPYDVLLFTGWPLAGLFVVGVWMASKRLYRNRSTPAHGEVALRAIDILALAMLLTFILVDLSGVAQGENARILSFYAPFLLLAGGGILAMWSRQWDVPLLAAQGLTVLVMATVLPVIPLDLNPPPEAPRTDVPTLDWLEPLPVGASFTSDDYLGAFQLEAHRFVADLGAQVITLETIWQGMEQVERPYHLEIVARAENEIDGQIITEPYTWYAQNGNYLPTCWRAGDRIHDVTLIPLPAVSAPVVWTLDLRAVDDRTGDVMRVTLPDGTVTDSVTLGPVNYP